MNMDKTGQAGLVSVVIPVYNGEKYLAEAIASVTGQSHRPLEVIIVDDGSTDSSADIAQSFSGITYCFQENAGLGSALNCGVDMAGGDFLAFLDADDVWTSGKLSRQMDVLSKDLSLDMVFAHVQQFCSPELGGVDGTRIPAALQVVPGFCAGTMLIRYQAFFQAGRFEPGLRLGQFLAWYSRAQDKGLRGRMLPDIMLNRRWHTANMGVVEREARSEYARILKASLDRRRAGQPPADRAADEVDEGLPHD